jgi:hypothetical protein
MPALHEGAPHDVLGHGQERGIGDGDRGAGGGRGGGQAGQSAAPARLVIVSAPPTPPVPMDTCSAPPLSMARLTCGISACKAASGRRRTRSPTRRAAKTPIRARKMSKNSKPIMPSIDPPLSSRDQTAPQHLNTLRSFKCAGQRSDLTRVDEHPERWLRDPQRLSRERAEWAEGVQREQRHVDQAPARQARGGLAGNFRFAVSLAHDCAYCSGFTRRVKRPVRLSRV